MPGKYTVVLTANGQQYKQTLTVVMDPRVKTSMADLQRQFELSNKVYQNLLTLQPITEQVTALRAKVDGVRAKASSADSARYEDLSKKLEAFAGAGGRRRGPQTESLAGTQGGLQALLSVIQEADVAPATPVAQAAETLNTSTAAMVQRWKELETNDVAPLKNQLGISDLRELRLDPASKDVSHSVNQDED
jgi:hypothetical protein